MLMYYNDIKWLKKTKRCIYEKELASMNKQLALELQGLSEGAIQDIIFRINKKITMRPRAPRRDIEQIIIVMFAYMNKIKGQGRQSIFESDMMERHVQLDTLIKDTLCRYGHISDELLEMSTCELAAYILFSDLLRFNVSMSVYQLIDTLIDRKQKNGNIWTGSNSFFFVYAALEGYAKEFRVYVASEEEEMLVRLKGGVLDSIITYYYKKEVEELEEAKCGTIRIMYPLKKGKKSDIDMSRNRHSFIEENNLVSTPRSIYHGFDVNDLEKALSRGIWGTVLSRLSSINSNDELLVALLPMSALDNVAQSILRKGIVTKGLLQAVIQLPPNLLYNNLTPMAILIFSEENKTVKMIDATDIFTKGRRQNTLLEDNIEDIKKLYFSNDKSLTISIPAIEDQEYIFTPSRYGKGMEFSSPAIELGKACKISRGSLLRANELDQMISETNTSIRYITPKDIVSEFIDLDTVASLKEDLDYKIPKIGKNTIIMSKLAPFKAAMVRDMEKKDILCNGNLYMIVSRDERINPIYLMSYLNSSVGQRELDKIVKGNTIKTISISDLSGIQIPILSKNEEEQFVKSYLEKCEEEDTLLKRLKLLRKNKERFVEDTVKKLIK